MLLDEDDVPELSEEDFARTLPIRIIPPKSPQQGLRETVEWFRSVLED